MISIESSFSGDATVLKLIGRLDVKAAREVDEAFEKASAEAKDMVLDLTELDYIASAGLRALKRLRTAVVKNGGTLTLRGVQEEVMDVLDLTGFSAMFDFE